MELIDKSKVISITAETGALKTQSRVREMPVIINIPDSATNGDIEFITWYKIKERLPEKYGMYLVTLNKLDTDFCEYYPKIKQFGFSGNICGEVTAWAYLPKPCSEYEEEIDGNS